MQPCQYHKGGHFQLVLLAGLEVDSLTAGPLD
jgi:hypothetical protein